MEAFNRNDVGEVDRLLEIAGPDLQAILDKHNQYGQTLLSDALHAQNFPIVKRLVDAGANVNDGKGMTLPPLRLAIRTGQIEVLDYLLDHGGDINLTEDKSEYTNTLVMNCLSAAREHFALHLLERGADFSDARKSPGGFTTVEMAARCGLPKVFFWLVEHGALIASGKLPLEVAVEQGREETVRACLDHAEYQQPMLDGRANQILASAANDAVRAALLSWRSEHEIGAAFDGIADPESTVPAPRARKAEMSL